MRALALMLVLFCTAPTTAFAHGGGLNKCGCHFNRRTGECHCHRPRACGCACEPGSCSSEQPKKKSAAKAKAKSSP